MNGGGYDIEDKKLEENKIKEENIAEEATKEDASEVKKTIKPPFIKRLTDWYVDYRKLIIGILCALTAAGWMTAKFGLTKGVLLIGKLGRPEYTDLYESLRNEILNVETNLVMTEFRAILFIAAIILLLCNVLAPARYESDKCPAACYWLFNFALITLGFSMLSYGVLLIGVFKILSVTSVMYILIGVFCFVLLPCTNKDFDAEHPGKYELKIGSYICGILGVILIVAIGFGNVMKDIITVKEEKERYEDGFRSAITFVVDWEDTSENGIFVRLHFYNNHNKDYKDYDYNELKESYLNLVQDNGKSWKLWEEFDEDYYDIYFGEYESDIYSYYDDAITDYSRLVNQQLYYEGYLDGNGLEQSMLGEEILAHACEEVDKIFNTTRNIEEYKEDIEITVNQPPAVGENASFDITYPENNGEYKAYIMKIGRVSHVGSENMLEEKNCVSQDEFIINDDSVYLLQFMVMSDLNHTLGEDIKVSIEGIDYEDAQVDTWTYSYHDSSIGEQKEAISINVWVTTGDCDGSYQAIESLSFNVPQGFCQGDSIEEASGLDTVKTDNPNAVVTRVSWSSDYPWDSLYDETEFSHEPKMYKLYATILSETGYGFSEDTVGSINGKQLPKWNKDMSDFWSGGYVDVENTARLDLSAYYYRITTDDINGSLVANYDYAASGTTVTLKPRPARGYKFKEYRVEIELNNADKYEKWKPVIENDTFIMPAAPIKITAVFEKE